MKLSRIQKLANGHEVFVENLLRKYPPLLESSIEELQKEIIQDNKEKLIHIIHKLKPNLDLIDSDDAHELSIYLLEQLKIGNHRHEEFTTKLTEFITHISTLNEQIKHWVTHNYKK